MAENADMHRTALAERVCEHFDFHDARGRPQIGSCLDALRALERAGRLSLPARRGSGGSRQRRRATLLVAAPIGVPSRVDEVRALEVILVETAEHREIWTGLMAAEHPRGAGPLVGCQLRYLIASEHGWLGAAGFAAAALQLAPRDHWIGWDAAMRRDQLHRIVGMSRFLIRPSVTCDNLASWALGQFLGRLDDDFEARYGYAPWLVETFVDGADHSGVSLRASNWCRIGQTAGRGRQDRDHEMALARKDIYVHPLRADWRAALGVGPAPALASDPLSVSEGIATGDWAHAEFGGAQLGDPRRTRRLVELVGVISASPSESFPAAAQGERAMVKGFYRFIDQPDHSAATPEAILQPHRERTLRRMRSERAVLCIQDGTDLNFATRPGCSGLGVIGRNQTSAETRGLHLHSTLAVSQDGVPLGVVRMQFDAPPGKDEAKQVGAKRERWLAGYRDCADMALELGRTEVICVMDREADMFCLYEAQRERPEAELLVRAKGSRRVTGKRSLLQALRAAPLLGRAVVSIERRTARPKSSKRPVVPGRAARRATLLLRSCAVTLAPSDAEHKAKPPMCLQGVLVEEERAPSDAPPIQWVLLTTLKVDSVDAAQRVVEAYARRWRIEQWHYVMKSGCKVEEMAHQTALRLQRAVTINAVVAWRILLMTVLGRERPDLPPDALFSEMELRVLRAFAAHEGLDDPTSLDDVVQLVARIGGYMKRARSPPGAKVMWRGMIALAGMCIGFSLAKDEVN